MTIWGFLKVRDELLRGNLERCIRNMRRVTDRIFVCDDASVDDSAAALRHWGIAAEDILRFDHPDFADELRRKQALLDLVHARAVRDGAPDWILWLDGDETLDRAGIDGLRTWLDTVAAPAVELESIQLLDGGLNYQTDDRGGGVRLWRYRPDLSFQVEHRTHGVQYPIQLREKAVVGPFRVLHYGYSDLANLRGRCVQYASGGGDGSQAVWNRIRAAPRAPTDPAWFPDGDAPRAVAPLGDEDLRLTCESFGDLRALHRTFCVVIPTYNRGDARLVRAIESVRAQSYPRWLLLVVDDGSTDGTADLVRPIADADPRVFYLHYPMNRRGVVVCEASLRIACEWTEWWSRLGSDDWWGPHKLAADVRALDASGADVVFGDHEEMRRDGQRRYHNQASHDDVCRELRAGGFRVCWTSIAARTSVLARVRARYGSFGDPRFIQMEDREVNRRLVEVGARFHWRPYLGDEPDSFYTVEAEDGESGPGREQTARRDHDYAVAKQIIAESQT